MTNVLLVTSNGTGMGHLTRQAAVALSMDPSHEATIFSLSPGLPLVGDLGIRGEYCISYDRPWIASETWKWYLCDRLVAIAEETESQVVLFDGVAPYLALAEATWRLRDVAFVWMRRGMWKEGQNKSSLRRRPIFDLVIEPGDLASEDDIGPTSALGDAVKVGPVSILEPLGMLPRAEARSRLGLPLEGPVALVTLGSGMLGDVAGPGATVVRTLLDKTNDWHIAVTKSPVARHEIPFDQADRLTQLSGVYPLATYLSAFDMAISSAGYNAVHELTPAGVPSLLVANTSTQTDDQVTRARSLERQGLALAAVDTDLEEMEGHLHNLLDDELRAELGHRATETRILMTGASETGQRATELGETFEYRRRTPARLVHDQVEGAKDLVRGALGEDRIEDLKRVLGRPPKPIYQKATVTLTDKTGGGDDDNLELALVSEVSTEELRSDQPVEHLLAGSSDRYQNKRREIIDHYYDVVSGSRPFG
ncbi:MAG: glycosyltransferase [Actinomycetota bacterium]